MEGQETTKAKSHFFSLTTTSFLVPHSWVLANYLRTHLRAYIESARICEKEIDTPYLVPHSRVDASIQCWIF